MPASPRPASAEPAQQIITAITPEALAQAMTQAGYKSQVVAGNNNTKLIKMSMLNGNAPVTIQPLDCSNQGCTFFMMYVGFPKNAKQTLELVNDFNSKARFARATIENGELYLTMESNLAGGVTVRHLQEEAGVFEAFIQSLAQIAM